MVFTTEGFSEVTIESRPMWNVRFQPRTTEFDSEALTE